MTRFDQIEKSFLDRLYQLSKKDRATFSTTVCPTTTEVIGVTNPDMRDTLKEFMPGILNLGISERIKLCRHFSQHNVFELRMIALEILDKSKETMRSLSPDDITFIGSKLENWANIDAYSVFILGYTWQAGIIDYNYILARAKSENVWIKRSAIVATVGTHLKSRGGKGNPAETLEICKFGLNDKRPMIVKAMSWALRELSKTNKNAAAAFLETYESGLHPQIIREVKKKLETGRKNG